MRKDKGFTLLEVLLSIALIALIVGILSPVFFSLLGRNNLDIAVNQTVQAIRRAKILAQSVEGDSPWGVKVQTNLITVFKGSSYVGRNAAFDENYDVASVTSVSGTSELIFSKLTGYPQLAGSIDFISTNNEQKTITINAKGGINY